MKTKSLSDYLNDDVDLRKKITYEEYENKKSAPVNSDYSLEEAYEEYCAVVHKNN